MASRIQLRRDTAAQWTANNPTLMVGEIGIATDIGDFKVGDGVSLWTALPFYVDKPSITFPSINTVPASPTEGVKLFGGLVGGRNMLTTIGPNGLYTTLQPHTGRNSISSSVPIGGSATTISTVGFPLTITGTLTGTTTTATNKHTQSRRVEVLVTAASTLAVAGYYTTAMQYIMGGFTGFHYIARFAPATGLTNATRRCFVGMSNSVAAPTDVNPSTLINAFGVGYDAADTNWQFMSNNASGTAVKVDLGINFPKPSADRTALYELALFSPPNSTDVYYQFLDLNTTAVVSGLIDPIIKPLINTLLAPRMYTSVGGTSAVTGMALMSLYIESDI